MNKFTADNIDTTLSTIESLILNCEKIQPKLQEGSSQQSLIKNRIKALCIAKSLITGKKHDFTAEEILKSAAPVTSIINKSTKAISHIKEGTGAYTRLKKIIDAMTISLDYIEEAADDSKGDK